MNIDSLEMKEKDRLLLLGMARAILKENVPIVITHGTDTMVESGQYLKRTLPELQVPIVMTGAMTPLGFEGSDGLQNLTENLFATHFLPPRNPYRDAWPEFLHRPRSQGQQAVPVCLDRRTRNLHQAPVIGPYRSPARTLRSFFRPDRTDAITAVRAEEITCDYRLTHVLVRRFFWK
jgi:Asparaginase, N-terminal